MLQCYSQRTGTAELVSLPSQVGRLVGLSLSTGRVYLADTTGTLLSSTVNHRTNHENPVFSDYCYYVKDGERAVLATEPLPTDLESPLVVPGLGPTAPAIDLGGGYKASRSFLLVFSKFFEANTSI